MSNPCSRPARRVPILAPLALLAILASCASGSRFSGAWTNPANYPASVAAIEFPPVAISPTRTAFYRIQTTMGMERWDVQFAAAAPTASIIQHGCAGINIAGLRCRNEAGLDVECNISIVDDAWAHANSSRDRVCRRIGCLLQIQTNRANEGRIDYEIRCPTNVVLQR